MNRTTLTVLMQAHGISRAELARRVGVSRQAVSLWFKQHPSIRVTGEHLLATAKALRKSPEQLTQPLPIREEKERKELMATLLWDRLFPSLEDFAVAINNRHPRALARLVEVYGLYASAKVAGRSAVWKDFPAYARFIPPVRRRQLEGLWSWKTSRLAS